MGLNVETILVLCRLNYVSNQSPIDHQSRHHYLNLSHSKMQTTLKIFDPFLLKPHDILLDEIQELLYYAESRFRQALLALSRADVKNQKWMLHLLGNETVGVFWHSSDLPLISVVVCHGKTWHSYCNQPADGSADSCPVNGRPIS